MSANHKDLREAITRLEGMMAWMEASPPDAIVDIDTEGSQKLAGDIRISIAALPSAEEGKPEGGYRDIINYVIGELEPMARQIISPKENVFEKLIRNLRNARDYPTESASPSPSERAERAACEYARIWWVPAQALPQTDSEILNGGSASRVRELSAIILTHCFPSVQSAGGDKKEGG